MKSSVFGCLGIVLVLLLLASVMLNVGLIAKHTSLGLADGSLPVLRPQPFEAEQLVPATGPLTRDRIAQIDLADVITGDDGPGGSMVSSIKRALRQAVEDERVRAIVLRIDSPGGEVTASDTLYAAVKEAAAKKKIVVYMDSVAASGGYYIACGATHIVAHPAGITGSIGVIMQGFGYQGLLEKVGMETRTFKSGTMKDAGSGARAMAPEEKDYFQRLIMQNYDRFVGIVSAARGIPVEELKAGIADGRIFLGEEAREKRLVDETGYVEAAYAAAKRLAGIKDAEVVRYSRQPGWRDFLGMLGEARSTAPKMEISLPREWLPRMKPGRCYYLWSGATE